MTNHVHLIVYPETDQSLPRAVAETHRRYTRYVNFREGWRGYLWQGRFGSVPLDETHLVAAMRYVERNPVDAGMVAQAMDYPWSSAKAHVSGAPDPLLSPCVLTEQIPQWAAFLGTPEASALVQDLEVQVRTGRPYGSEAFLARLERQVGQRLRRLPPGPQPKR
jgi:putative transposase